MKIISIYLNHDGNITIFNNGQYQIIELEKLYGYKNFPLGHGAGVYADTWHSYNYISLLMKECNEYIYDVWGIENDYDVLLYNWIKDPKRLKSVTNAFNAKKNIEVFHQFSHACCSFYQSSFNDALVCSIDGWGNDGNFHIYDFKDKDIELLEKKNITLGMPYCSIGRYLPQIGYKEVVDDKVILRASMAGKIMGLCGYGEIDQNWTKLIHTMFMDFSLKHNVKGIDKLLIKMLTDLGLDYENITEEQGRNLAATFQHVFENIFIENISKYVGVYKNLCLSGGCALNILLTKRLKESCGFNVFVPPNPNDCGSSIGSLLSYIRPLPAERQELVYSGMPFQYSKTLQKKAKSNQQLIDLLLEEKFIGIIKGNCECGPRALGNRSLICLTTIKDLKYKLNLIKQREHFRPFGLIVCEDDLIIYFKTQEIHAPYMNTCFDVKDEWSEKIKEIIHVDGTCRVQTIDQKHHLYDVLKALKAKTGIGLVVNTSLNIKGEPLVNNENKAFHLLEYTNIDFMMIDDQIYQSKYSSNILL